MDKFSYRPLNTATKLIQAFPQASASDNVLISIYDINDNALDVNSVAMTFENGVTWSYDYTPNEAHFYQVTYFNATLGVEYYETINIVGSAFAGGGSGTGSTLSTLRTRFLKLIDNYNANDLTGTNSSGEIADLCINDALQLIYSLLKDSKYLQSYSGTLSSVAGQSYIDLSGITDIDEVASMKDTTNNITLRCMSAHEYFSRVPNPAQWTGTPSEYCRIFNRVYLNSQPTAVIAYTVEYVKNYARLAADADQALIPSKYDDWIMKEARVIWLMMEDINSVPQMAISERDQAREIYVDDVMSQFDQVSESQSHWDRRPYGFGYPYQRPIP